MEENLVIKMDTREKINKKTQLLKYFDNHNIKVERIKLDVGDYSIKGYDGVSVDLKQDITEIATNMFCDKDRFERECIRAKNNNILLIFLIQEKCDKIKLLKWRAKEKINGKRFLNVYGWQIYNEMKIYVKLFGVKFRFCHKLSTGKTLLDILINENKKLDNNIKFNK